MTIEELNKNAKRLEKAIKKDPENKDEYIKEFADSFQSLEITIDGRPLILRCKVDRGMIF